VQAIEAEIETGTGWADTYKQVRQQIAEHEKQVRAYRRALRGAQSMDKFYEYCAGAFSRDGIPQFLNQSLVPVLNKHADYYSNLFCDKTVQVRFAVVEGEFDVTTANAMGGERTDDQSTGERALAGIIASFALRNIAPRANVLILDEPGEGLDPGNARQFAQALPTLAKTVKTIFITTHNPAILSELGEAKKITITKRKGISQVSV
jgi:DNA repair exonuclease SbcCD ATPase subunit